MLQDSENTNLDSVTTYRDRWVGGGREGICFYLWLIHVDIWQKPTQYCKAIILQLKIIQYYKVISLQLIKINEKKKNETYQKKEKINK